MNLASHFQLTPKSVGALVAALATMAAAFHWLDAAQAESVTAVAAALLAFLVPARSKDV